MYAPLTDTFFSLELKTSDDTFPTFNHLKIQDPVPTTKNFSYYTKGAAETMTIDGLLGYSLGDSIWFRSPTVVSGDVILRFK